MCNFQQKRKKNVHVGKDSSCDFSKIQFFGNQDNRGPSLCIEFHDHRPNSLGREESQKNYWNGIYVFICYFRNYFNFLLHNILLLCLTLSIIITNYCIMLQKAEKSVYKWNYLSIFPLSSDNFSFVIFRKLLL